MYAMSDDRMSADRGKAVEAALSNIEKKFGKGSIMRLGEREVSDVPAISTTSLSLDAAVGVGGARLWETLGTDGYRTKCLAGAAEQSPAERPLPRTSRCLRAFVS